MADYLTIATWPFGMTAVKKAAELLAAGRPALDAVIAGAQDVEDDPKVMSVGYGGVGNAIGTVSLDSCVMDGQTLACGGVACVENIRHVAALARLVMEKTPHVLVVGQGAQQFALQHGFPLQTLLTPESVAAWERGFQRRQRRPQPVPATGGRPGSGGRTPPGEDHDTVTVLARDQKGSLAGVCTTSGLAFKLPGRVGDSPLIGHGLYVDNEAGAAGATGTGEEIIRIGGSLLVVEAMRNGRSPQEACEQAVRKHHAVAVRRGKHPDQVCFLAMDPRGRVGAACTEGSNFEYAVARPGKVELIKARALGVNDR